MLDTRRVFCLNKIHRCALTETIGYPKLNTKLNNIETFKYHPRCTVLCITKDNSNMHTKFERDFVTGIKYFLKITVIHVKIRMQAY